MNEICIASLRLMGKGMLAIFTVIILVMLLVMLLTRITKK